jgi:hypothetical protein
VAGSLVLAVALVVADCGRWISRVLAIRASVQQRLDAIRRGTGDAPRPSDDVADFDEVKALVARSTAIEVPAWIHWSDGNSTSSKETACAMVSVVVNSAKREVAVLVVGDTIQAMSARKVCQCDEIECRLR